MNCPKCGNKNQKSDKFCKKCGEKLFIEEKTNQKQEIQNNNQKSGLSIAGFVLGIITSLITRIVYVLSTMDDVIDEHNIMIFVIIGIIVSIALIIGFIMSFVGYMKTRNVFGIIGILLNGYAFVYEVLTIITIASDMVGN